ncbi:MAG: HD domain-containing protein [Saprospiraceae bacterium]|nr:HD domain-containing protein [Saprospiraceae bacterium]MDP4822042.1 HD domain-containing protein [Saprospiraceae bacterium]
MSGSSSRQKIMNDPVYGFVSIPSGTLFQLIEHPYFQRLRRIKQVSLTHLVYPGALHTRFHHAIGALHLMKQAIEVLRSKGVSITDEEALGVSAAILLHDIGHGPFSHTLENTLIQAPHEALSLLFMEQLNKTFEGQLELAMDIFQDRYERRFFHQLVSGQLDMDRMDYLNRDSYFTGVYEGVIGYDRIIQMLSVVDDQLVVEEKGIYSIEKFLMARRLMYWQVYLHKTVLAAEQMLIMTLRRARELTLSGKMSRELPSELNFFLHEHVTLDDFMSHSRELLDRFARLDDYDIMSALKLWAYEPDHTLSYLASGLLDRKLLRVELRAQPFDVGYIQDIRDQLVHNYGFDAATVHQLIVTGRETNTAYSVAKDEINILYKDGRVLPMSAATDYGLDAQITTKHYLCYPKTGL